MNKVAKMKPALIIFILQIVVALGLTAFLIRIVVIYESDVKPALTEEKLQESVDRLNQHRNTYMIFAFDREHQWRLQSPPTAQYLEEKMQEYYPAQGIFYKKIVVLDTDNPLTPTKLPEYKVLHILRGYKCIEDRGDEEYEGDLNESQTLTHKDIVTPDPTAGRFCLPSIL